MDDSEYRYESDSLGEVRVPADRLYGAQTQRAVQNFRFSDLRLPSRFVRVLGMIKSAAAQVNVECGKLAPEVGNAIVEAAGEVAEGFHDDEFPVDVFQTGSGTSTNMNANEVIARRATALAGSTVHPNDHVNLGQSSNDVIPTAIHVSAALALRDRLYPGVSRLESSIERKSEEAGDFVKTGRTHLMDAMPLRVGQELSGWAAQLRDGRARLAGTEPRLFALAIGGTAVGTGVNTHVEFGRKVASVLARETKLPFAESDNHFRDLASQDTAVELSGQLRTLAVTLMKIANDLRWMNSGPLSGLGEVTLPALQPGSSIMPGKVNPVIPEAVCMAAARVLGSDTTIAIAGQSGSFQLNVMLPLIASELLQSIELLANACTALSDQAIRGLHVNEDNLHRALAANPILVTALTEHIGYDKAAAIGKLAYERGLPIVEVALTETDLDRESLEDLLNPRRLTQPHNSGI